MRAFTYFCVCPRLYVTSSPSVVDIEINKINTFAIDDVPGQQARRYRGGGAQGGFSPPSGNACPPVGEFWYFSSGMAIGHMTMFHCI